MNSKLQLDSLLDALGEGKISFDSETLTRYSSSLSGNTCPPLAIVFPESEADVIRVVQLAQAHNLQLFPISRGRNMGYGDAQGTVPGQVIVDLRKMNQIVEVDERQCFVTLQPGVSQGQLYDHIRAQDLRVQLDVTGAGLDASIVGNVLERGFGHTDYGDRFAQVLSLRAVLADGSVVQTGLRPYSRPNVVHGYRYGIGPVVDGLFSQSNFGIITEMTLALMPKPDTTVTFAGSIRSKVDLADLVDAVREARLSGIVNSAVHIANRSRTAGNRSASIVGAWNVSGCLSGPRSLVKAKQGLLKTLLKKKVRSWQLLVFIGPMQMRILRWFHEKIHNIPLVRPLFEVYQLQNGIPTDDSLKTLLDDEFVESRTLSVSQYPFCFGWINAVVSAQGTCVIRAVGLLEELFLEWGYEFRVTMTAVNPRTLILISNITYKREESEIAKAKHFAQVCHHALNEAGFLPYRSGSGDFPNLPVPEASYLGLLGKLKGALDPSEVFAPGKYGIPKLDEEK